MSFIISIFLITQIPTSANLNNLSNAKFNKDREDSHYLPYSREAVKQVARDGRVAFVHFTADWCLNCKVSEKLVLNQDKTQQLFSKHGVVLFKADWTRASAIIFNEIKRLGRAGIPLDVFYFPISGRGEEEVVQKPILMGEILTYASLEETLNDDKNYEIYEN